MAYWYSTVQKIRLHLYYKILCRIFYIFLFETLIKCAVYEKKLKTGTYCESSANKIASTVQQKVLAKLRIPYYLPVLVYNSRIHLWPPLHMHFLLFHKPIRQPSILKHIPNQETLVRYSKY
jgi:hypothetical protein